MANNKNTEKSNSGRKFDQKMKPLLVYFYLMKYSDEFHPKKTEQIVDFLKGNGLSAERRSIYNDIKQINRFILMRDEEMTLSEVKDNFNPESDEYLVYEPAIIYDKHRKAFYAKHHDLDDIRMLIECVYAARFISETRAQDLIDTICNLVSTQQADMITHEAYLVDRVKSENTKIPYVVNAINKAMSTYNYDDYDYDDDEAGLDNKKEHTPEKISFDYLHYSIDDLKQKVSKRKAGKFVVSPYHLIINDNNYYLLGYDDQKKAMRTYRVDRMQNVELLGEPRDGGEAASAIDLKSYTKRVFSMFGGEATTVTLQFINPLLDTVVDRFGAKGIIYSKIDNDHFQITTEVELSDQFFGWICGLGRKVVIMNDSTRKKYKEFLDRISAMYE